MALVQASVGWRVSMRVLPAGARLPGALTFKVEPSGFALPIRSEAPDTPPPAAVLPGAAAVGDVGVDFLSPQATMEAVIRAARTAAVHR